jgi:hypothetical protein
MTSRYSGHDGFLTRSSLGVLWGLGMLWGIATMATAAAAATFVLPPLVQPASSDHHEGKVIWADLVTPDVAGAKRFYGELLGWTGYGVNFYDAGGYAYGGWGPGYGVGPPRRGGDRGRPDSHAAPHTAYRPASPSRSMPSLPSRSRGR